MTAHEVDVSVLVPVLNEAAARARRPSPRCRRSASTATLEFLFIDGARRTPRARSSRSSSSERPAHPRARQPGAAHPAARSTSGCAARAGVSWRAWTRTRCYPPTTSRAGVERLRRGRRGVGQRPAASARATARWSRRVALALGSRLGTGGAAFRRRPTRDGDRGRRAASRASGGARRWSAWRLGRGLAHQPGRRAGRAHPSPPAGASSACRELAAEYVPRDSLQGARAPVLPLRAATAPRRAAGTPTVDARLASAAAGPWRMPCWRRAAARARSGASRGAARAPTRWRSPRAPSGPRAAAADAAPA